VGRQGAAFGGAVRADAGRAGPAPTGSRYGRSHRARDRGAVVRGDVPRTSGTRRGDSRSAAPGLPGGGRPRAVGRGRTSDPGGRTAPRDVLRLPGGVR